MKTLQVESRAGSGKRVPAFSSGVWPDSDARVLLRNGRFADVASGTYYPAGTQLLVKGDRIVAMPGLPGQPLEVESDIAVDLAGRSVIPGLFNTHSHVQMVLTSLLSGWQDLQRARRFAALQIEKNLADCLAHGVTHVRDAWTEDLRPNRTLRERIARREIPGPRIYQAVLVSPLGGTFAAKRGLKEKLMFALLGMPAVDFEDPASGVVTFRPQATESEVRQAVDRAVDERGAEYIKFYDQRERRISYRPGAMIMTEAQLSAATDQARHRGLFTTMHHLTLESFRRGVAAGVSSLAHVPYDGPLDETDIDAFLRAGCILEPTLSLAYDYCWPLTQDRWRDDPRMLALQHFRNSSYGCLAAEYWLPELQGAVVHGVERANRGNLSIFGLMDMSYVYRYYSGIVTLGIANTAALLSRNALVACANDAGADPRTPAMVGLELSMFSLCGCLSGADALRIATLNSARAMGLEDSFGSIEPGKVADLVVLEGDPLHDSEAIGAPASAVFMAGRLVVDNWGLRPQCYP